MLAAEHYSEFFADVALPKNELLAIHRSRISLHRAKASYSYPTIRLPPTFIKLAGLPTRIYQTVHEGALAFLVVVSAGAGSTDSPELLEHVEINAKTPVLTWRRTGSNPAEPTSVCKLMRAVAFFVK